MPNDSIIWDDEQPDGSIQWDDEKPKTAPYQPYQGIDPASDTERFGENPGTGAGGAEFHQGIASTPARLVKSLAQMAGQGDRLPEVVNQSAQVADTGFGTAGRIVGDVAATALPMSAVGKAAQGLSFAPRMGVAAAENAAYGAALSPDEQADAAKWGAIFGPVAHGVSRIAGGVVKPTEDARILMDRGVNLTPGQAAGVGSFANRTEQAASSMPIAGHFVTNAQRRAVDEANRAAAQSVTNIVDQNVKVGLPPREAIEKTREVISKTYDAALEGMSVPGFVPEAALGQKIGTIAADHPMLEKSQLDQMKRYVSQRVGQMVRNNNGNLTGDMLKQVDSEIGQQIRNLRSSTNAADKTAAPAWADLQQSLREVMEMSHASPEQSMQLKQANAAYRQLLALEKSMLPGADRFTPRQLRRSLDKMGIRGTELNQVADAMESTLPNTMPNSGTAERLLTAGLPAMLIGGGAGAQSMGWDTVGTGMMAAGALGSRPGTRFLTGDLTGQKAVADALRRVVPRIKPGKDEQ